MDDIDKLIDEILKVDKKAFITKLQEKAKPFYQAIFNEGHASATGTSKSEKTALEAKLEAAEAKVVEVEAEFTEYKSKAPDTVTLEKQWSEKVKAAKDESKALKEAMVEERKGNKRTLANSTLLKFLSDVDGDYADALVSKPGIQNRLSFDENTNLRVLQPGQDIPFAGDEEAQLKALAEEIRGTVKPIFIVSTAGAGSGRGSPGAGGGAGGKSQWETIREKARATVAPDGIADKEAELNRRLGKVPV